MDLAKDIHKAYQELDLTPGASLDEVKDAYRRLARALHPDLHPGAMGALMSRVNQAYERLVRHLESRHPHQAGPARASNRQSPNRAQSKRRPRQDGFKAYEYEEFTAQRGAHGEHARRYSAWQELKRRFYDQARRAAQAAAETTGKTQTSERAEIEVQENSVFRPAPKRSRLSDEAQVISPSDPRIEKQEEEPMAGPVGLDRQPAQGWRLLGLDKQNGVLLYRVELSGRPAFISLPVRCCRPCRLCQGAGQHRDAAGRLRRCAACGGRGRIARADQVQVELPKNWRPGQCIQVPACNSENQILVELNQA